MSICARCGAQFSCAIEDKTHKPCWCMQLPPLPDAALEKFNPGQPEAGCMCPNCLGELVREAASNQSTS